MFGTASGPFPPSTVSTYTSVVNSPYQNGASQTPPPPLPQSYATRTIPPMPNSSSSVGPPPSHPQSVMYSSQSAVQQPLKSMYNQPQQTPNVPHQLVNQMSNMTLNPPLSKPPAEGVRNLFEIHIKTYLKFQLHLAIKNSILSVNISANRTQCSPASATSTTSTFCHSWCSPSWSRRVFGKCTFFIASWFLP